MRTLLTLLIAAFAAGCASEALPPRLAPEQAALAREASFPVAVAVERDVYPVYSEHLARALAESGAFERVGPVGEVPAPRLIARVERHVHGKAVIPLFPALSLGLIPMSFEDEHGYVFSLRLADDPGRKVMIDASYRGRTTIGWYGLLKSASPDYTASKPEKDERYVAYLRWAIAARMKDLL